MFASAGTRNCGRKPFVGIFRNRSVACVQRLRYAATAPASQPSIARLRVMPQ
jgi:hypothetical protein